jgi:hypothetical protein
MLADVDPKASITGVDGHKVRINATWFGSLVASLLVILFSVQCKQWLNTFDVSFFA